MIKIMITCVGGELMPQTIKHLKSIQGIKVSIVGTDYDENAIGKHFCDKFYKVPKGNSRYYISKCDEIIKKEKINLIIPTSDEEAISFSKKKEYFKRKNVIVTCIDFNKLKVLNDKSKTYSKLNELNIKSADWSMIKNRKALVDKLNFYFEKYGGAVIKPSLARGSRNIFIVSKNEKKYTSNKNITVFTRIKDFTSLLEDKKFYKNFLIMQELFEPVVDIDLLSWSGNPLSVIPRKRIHPLYPNMGHKILNDKKLISLGEEIIKKFNLSWLYDCDVMFDKNKNPIVIEINPRQSGSIAVSIEAGFKIFDKLIKLYMNKKVNPENNLQEKIIVPYKSLLKISN